MEEEPERRDHTPRTCHVIRIDPQFRQQNDCVMDLLTADQEPPSFGSLLLSPPLCSFLLLLGIWCQWCSSFTSAPSDFCAPLSDPALTPGPPEPSRRRGCCRARPPAVPCGMVKLPCFPLRFSDWTLDVEARSI